MKLIFLGDSITEGAGASSKENTYVAQVATLSGNETVNFGVGGTRIAKQRNISDPLWINWDFLSRSSIMPLDADKVFVFGGTNDYGHGDAYLGAWDNKDPYTFYGALRLLVESLIERYGREKLCFILPLARASEEGLPCKGPKQDEMGESLERYVAAIEEVLQKYGVPYLDFYRNGLPDMSVNGAYSADGLHPNDAGHRIIAEKICAYLNEEAKATK